MDWAEFPKTAVEFDERFATEEACRDYLMRTRWPEGFRCPRCRGKKAWDLGSRNRLQCAGCRYQASLTAGTIFHGTRKPLRLWFKAIFLAASHKTGTSARNLMRQLGLHSYQTAWTWLHKIRRAMVRPNRETLHGLVEVDETIVGSHRDGVFGRDVAGKALVAIAVEVRDEAAGRLRMEHLPNASAAALHPFVQRNVAVANTLRTDGWHGYWGIKAKGYRQNVRKLGDRPERAVRLFPHVHRSASLLKRWLLGTYHGAPRPKCIQAYLDEFVFRFNRRRSASATLPFRRVCEIAVVTPPLPYRALVAQHLGVA